MTWYRTATTEKEMEEFFEKRTKKHIALVQKYCKKIADYDKDKYGELIERGEVHDASKFESPEKEPYLYISWQYKCKDEGKEFEIPKNIQDAMNEATQHHVVSNRHHPEYHCGKKVGLINREDRDKPIDEIIDATKMTDLDIAEMVADFSAMSEERNNTPKKWADKNVNIRWKFTDKQKALIYELIEEIW